MSLAAVELVGNEPALRHPERMDEEEALVGGMDPQAGVVRIGNTVRRPAGSSSAAVRALLVHLQSVGFDGAPRSWVWMSKAATS